MYQLLNTTYGGGSVIALNAVKRLSDNAFIPMDPANTDYVEYLEWLAAGNQPIPAEEGNE